MIRRVGMACPVLKIHVIVAWNEKNHEMGHGAMKYTEALSFAKPYRGLIAGTTLSLIIFTNLGLLMPMILKIVIDNVLGGGDLGYLHALLITILLIYAIREIFFYVSHYLTFYVAQRILFDVRAKLFKHLQSLSLRFYEEYRTGKLISNVITDVAKLQQMISSSIMSVVVNVLMTLFIVAILFFMDPLLALLSLTFMPFYFFNFTWFKKRIRRDSEALRERMSEISGNLAEVINGVKVVKSFAKERTESRSFVSQLRPTFDLSMDINMKSVSCHMIAEYMSVTSRVLVLGVGGHMVVSGRMSLGEFVAFFSYLGMLTAPVNALSGLAGVVSEGLASASRIMGLLNTAPEIKDAESPVEIADVRGEVGFEDVSFGYNGKPVVKKFNLTISPGEKVALVGPSGSGKSTVANLLLRFYDVNDGRVTLDGRDIRELRLSWYRDNVGVVLQEPFLFSGSILENIRYSEPEATAAEVAEAARQANAAEFIEAFDDGYETRIGENGATLSGGQKQRVAIARAILKDPRILILDEATSALDTSSERAVQEALDRLMENKTTLIIAHRLSTIKNADKIVVMEAGEVKQIGSHEELMKAEGLYRNLYRNQLELRTFAADSKSSAEKDEKRESDRMVA